MSEGGPPVVPGYLLETLLGRGGSGEVWRAVPRRGGPAVAVKVLVDGDPERQAREAALLGELDHPHLVRLIEVVHQPRRGGAARVALVLELLEGGSLAALLARRGRLRPGEVVTTIAPVAAALAHAHANGVVHGDLSPGNIVFTADGRPVLTDLGVARVLGEQAAGEVTPPYVDPTVARGGAPGPASDVFGVAAAAFHALTGVAPWNAATPADTLLVAAAGYLPDLPELAPDPPAELVAVVERGLSADPHDRGSAAAFALDLRHACRPEPVRLPVPGIPDADLGRTGRGPRTELTHQVPGRRPRPAPAVVEFGPAGRLSEVRDRLTALADRRTAVLAGAAGILVAAGLAALAWGPSAGEPTRPDVAAATSAAPVQTSAERPAAAASPQTDDWAGEVEELYRRRAAAFEAASLAELDDVYAPDSPLLAADQEHVRALAAAGETLQGFAPEVVRLEATDVGEDRVELNLVDRWPDYRVVNGDGALVRTGTGRPESAVRMVLVRGAEGWRIETASRTG
jgi:hypothetical protein